jgi:hypothetical protein
MLIHGITPILRVTSVPRSIAWFESLGWKRGFSWNDGGMIADGADRNAHGEAGFGSVRSGMVEIFLCHGGQGSLGTLRPKFPGDDSTDGVWMSWWLGSPAEVDAVHAAALARKMDVSMPPRDEPWGVREFHLRHPDGHTFRVSSRADNCD